MLELIAEMLTLVGGLIIIYIIYVLISRRDDNPSADSPSMAHTALREIVERAVEEARKLPGLGGSSETGSAQEGRNIVDHSYEDLLATAILNKVIEKYQKEQVDGNSNVLHGKPVTAAKCTINEIEAGLDEGVEEGCSSLEPLSQDECSSDCSASRSRHPRNQPESLSLTIEERIEEVTTVYTSDEDPRDNDVLSIRNTHRVPFPELGMDIIDPSQDSEDSQDEVETPTTHMGLVSPIESWEENWLFQKKRVQTQADPVAMLVPNPSADYKALIGDKDAEDTSDLSECSSAQSDEEIEKELMEAINNVVPRTPTDLVFENGLDSNFEASKDIPKIEETEKTDPETLLYANVAGNEDKIEREFREPANDVESTLISVDEAKEADVKIETSEKVAKKPVPESTSPVDDNPKIEMECRSTAEELEEKVERGVQNFNVESTNGDSSTEPRELDRNDPSGCDDVEEGFKSQEDVSDVPKTFSCTPTKTSGTEVGVASVGNAEAFVAKEENALHSSECVKKTIHVDEDALETFEEEEKSDEQRNDFQAEDIQQESEYTEHYDTATQRHLDSLTKTEIPVVENGSTDVEADRGLPDDEDSRCREAVALAKASSASRFSLRSEKEQTQLATPPRPGTIAEREHKKWENAPPIENNPYSQENIQKRLWERQYSRRPSEIPGIHAELPKSNGTDLEVVLTPQEPDIKRFGRDYYINDSRTSNIERGRRSTASTLSRPSSSLSQGSSSTGPDQEQQEDTRYKENEYLMNKSNDVKSKVAKWQRNNSLENKFQSSVRNDEDANEMERGKGDGQKTWEDQKIEEILENERKNSKNEINAKLNNQENYNGIETKMSNSENNQKKIKRIDLKAYGFENEFCVNRTTKTSSSPRVVNKLDLKSFGYDGGIRRTQSNIHLNSMSNDEFKPRIGNKSNLSHRNGYGNDRDVLRTLASGDNNLTQSSEALNELRDESYNGFGLKPAKSVPNIARCFSNNSSNQEDEEVESYNGNSYTELETIKNGSVRSLDSSNSMEKNNAKSSASSVDESEIDTDNCSEKEQPMINGNKKIPSDENADKKTLPLPSVRRLAQAFNKQAEHAPMLVSKINKPTTVNKDRSSTPEIQIVETPRQMHSLTARSLSKQFREGLRQIPNKVTSPPASHVTMEQTYIPENQTEVVPAKSESTSSDTKIILPGKLKSNIIFWEQMQRKS